MTSCELIYIYIYIYIIGVEYYTVFTIYDRFTSDNAHWNVSSTDIVSLPVSELFRRDIVNAIQLTTNVMKGTNLNVLYKLADKLISITKLPSVAHFPIIFN